MPSTAQPEQRIVFLGSRIASARRPLPERVAFCRNRTELGAILGEAPREVTWVSLNRAMTDLLLKEAISLGPNVRAWLRKSHLLTLAPPRLESIPTLLSLFHPVSGLVEGFRWLPREELVAVLTRAEAAERFIGGNVDVKAKALTLLRGDLSTVVAPMALFEASGDGTKPDFSRLGFTDYGRTIVLGDYEASADAVLYELDSDYRRELKKRRQATEQSFGASLMRLRKQKRLRRGDFAPITPKQIARLERGETEKPQKKTLQVIADRLGVRPEEIEDY